MPRSRDAAELLPISHQQGDSSSGPQVNSYQSFAEVAASDNDPLVMIQVAPESSVKYSSWQNYIQDLDAFFTRIYEYHRRSGLTCIIIDKLLSLGQFVFVICFCVFLLHLVDYDVMFKRPGSWNSTVKVTIKDVIKPLESVSFSGIEIFMLLFASFYWVVLFVRMIHYIVIQHAIRGFYHQALSIKDCSAYTWVEVQDRLIKAQQHVLIQESAIDELDVHNRILRRTNYLIGLMNKGLIPVNYHLPIIGDVTHLSEGFLFNLNLLLFATIGPGALFEKNWKLRNEVKVSSNRMQMAQQFSFRCKTLSLINLLLLPLIFLWQILYLFFTYAEVLKRDPSMLFGSRNWSPYSRLLCRHLNELDHQLDDRLNRGYKCATKYMNSFTSPLLEIIAKHVAFIASSILAVLILLTIYDEDVITVEHVITIITGLGAVIAISRAFIADVIPQKHSQSELYTQLLEHVHYIPTGYPAYSIHARSFVSTLFPYRITTLIESLISPIATPIILAFCLPSRSEQIVDFFRICTKEVPGTGDVCNFAMFNIRDQGNEAWKPTGSTAAKSEASGDKQKQQHQDRDVVHMRAEDTARDRGVTGNRELFCIPDHLICTEDGKLELSLIHFKLTNPKWHPSEAAQDQFIDFVTKESIREIPEYEYEYEDHEAGAGGGAVKTYSSPHHESIEGHVVPGAGGESLPTSSIMPASADSSHHQQQQVQLSTSRFRHPHRRPSSRPRSRQQSLSINLQSLSHPFNDHHPHHEANEILNRERSRVLNSLHSDHNIGGSRLHSLTGSRLDSNLCMTLSTLFLHEYAGAAAAVASSAGAGHASSRPSSSLRRQQYEQYEEQRTSGNSEQHETASSSSSQPSSSQLQQLPRSGSGYE